MIDDDLLTTAEACALLGMREKFFHTLRSTWHDLPAVPDPADKRRRLYRRGDLLAWREAHPLRVEWTPEMLAKAKAWRLAGHTAEVIAARLGDGLTAGAVASQLQRKGVAPKHMSKTDRVAQRRYALAKARGLIK